MDKKEPTHIVFYRNNNWIMSLSIPANLKMIFDSLIEAEEEIESFLGFEKQLQEIKNSYQKILDFIAFLVKKV